MVVSGTAAAPVLAVERVEGRPKPGFGVTLFVICRPVVLGIPYDLQKLDGAKQEQYGEAFVKINPKSKVPTLQKDDGSVVTDVTGTPVRWPWAPCFDSPVTLRALAGLGDGAGVVLREERGLRDVALGLRQRADEEVALDEEVPDPEPLDDPSLIQFKGSRGNPVHPLQTKMNRAIATLRYKVEQGFGTMKRRFHLSRARYFGVAKTQAQMVWAALGYLPAIAGAAMQEVVDLISILGALRAVGAGRAKRSRSFGGRDDPCRRAQLAADLFGRTAKPD